MGRKVWTQETLSVPDMQELLQDQTVMVFDSAAQRGVEITDPTDGMVSYLRDLQQFFRYRTGVGWYDLFRHPTVRVFRSGAGVSYASTSFLAIPWNAVDNDHLFDPGGLTYAWDFTTFAAERRVTIKRAGLYRFELESVGTGTISATRISEMAHPTTYAQSTDRSLGSSLGISLGVTRRVAAGAKVAGLVIQSANDAADGSNGYRHHLIITRISD